ncbi:MAG: CBS domain-containing protein [Terriglobia bacterium]
MTVGDLIRARQEVFFVHPENTVLDAACYLRDRQIRAAGVCNQQGSAVGIISQSDMAAKVVAENKCPAWVRVSEIMSADLSTVTPETPLEECLQIMEGRGIFHLLILDAQLGFRGLISAKDLLKVIASDSKYRADMLESYVSPRWA